MKRLLQNTALVISLVLAGSVSQKAIAQVNVDVNISYQTFYDELSPYGEWVDYPDYGYAWVPEATSGFMPYQTNGHWVWTDDYGWMWASDYSWGWAPFHYGRWFYDDYYGWMWLPGYEWSPAWVCWRDGGDYYGWAPLRPGFNISIGFSNYNPPSNYWCFAPRQYISSPRIYDYCLDRGRNYMILNQTTIINQYHGRGNYYFNGPRREDAERYSGRIESYRFRESNRPGRAEFGRNEVSFYRPRVNRDGDRGYSPRRFERYEAGTGNERGGFGRQRQQDNGSWGGNGSHRDNGYGRRNDDNGRFDNPRRNDRRVMYDGNTSQPGNRDYSRGTGNGQYGNNTDRGNEGRGYGRPFGNNNGNDRRDGGNNANTNSNTDRGRWRNDAGNNNAVPNNPQSGGFGRQGNRTDRGNGTTENAYPRRFDRSSPQSGQQPSGDFRRGWPGNNGGGAENRTESRGNGGGQNRQFENGGRSERSGGGGRGGWRRG